MWLDIPADVQTAEIPDNTKDIEIRPTFSGNENIEHLYYVVHAKDRYLALKRIADYNPDIFAIVFCRTKAETQQVADALIKDGYNADALHGDLSQAQRDFVMKRSSANIIKPAAIITMTLSLRISAPA